METHVPEIHFCSDLYYHDIKTDNVIKVRYINYDMCMFQYLEYMVFFYLTWNFRFIFICMQSYRKIALLIIFWSAFLFDNSNFFNNLNICSCVYYVLVFKATSNTYIPHIFVSKCVESYCSYNTVTHPGTERFKCRVIVWRHKR